MTITWDEALVDELCGRPLMLNSRPTMSCARTSATGSVDSTPSWPQLLQLLSAASRCSADDLKHVENLSEKERYLDAAQIIRTNLTNQRFGRILTNEFKNLETKGLHNAGTQTRSTNCDDHQLSFGIRGSLYARGWADGYSVLNYYDSGLANRLRSPTRLILKLHGSVKHPEQTVLTRSEYSRPSRTILASLPWCKACSRPIL